MALATPNQLWRLNKLGRLEVVPGSTPMTHTDADVAIKVAEGTCCGMGDCHACSAVAGLTSVMGGSSEVPAA